MLRTALQYAHLFEKEEKDTIMKMLNLQTLPKTVYTRIFFRKRCWYTHPNQLKAYSESETDLKQALKTLSAAQLLSTDEDAVYETCFERLHELFECMQMQCVRVVDDELTKLHKGTFDCRMPSTYANVGNNPFWHLHRTGEVMEGAAG